MSPSPLNENARDWAERELFRWQHGGPPVSDDSRRLDVVAGASAMADALERGDASEFPTIENTTNVLRYLAERIAELRSGSVAEKPASVISYQSDLKERGN